MPLVSTGVRYDVIARDSASRVFRTVGDNADRLGGRLGKLAKATAYAGAAMAGGLAAGMAVSTEKAVKFEASMMKIQTQAGATAGDVKVLSAQVLGLAKTSQQGPEKLSEALYHLKSVGMDNADAMKALKTSSDLAAVGGADLEATTNALAGAWRTGIKGATSFGQSAATLNSIIGAGNMTMEDMVAALGTGILPTAKTFGLTFAQVGGALALFTDEGVDSASAATRLRMSISLLAAGSPAANKQLAKIGLTTDKLGNAMRSKDGLIGAVSLLKDHLDKSGLSATKQAALLSRAFGGGKSSSAILSMINNLDVLRKKQDQVNAGMGKYGPAVEAQRKTAAAQFSLLKSNLDVFAIKTGDKLLPPLTKFVTYINTTVLPESGRVSRALMSMVPVAQIERGLDTIGGLVDDFMRGFDKAPAKKKTLTLPTPTIKVPSTLIPDGLRKPLEVPSPTLKMATTPIPAGLKAPAPVKSQAQKLGEQLRGLISGGIGDAVGKVNWGKTGKQIGVGLGKAVDWVGAHGSDLVKRLAKAVGGLDWANVGKGLGVVAVPFAIGFVDNLFSPLFTTSFWSKHWLDTIIAAISVLPIDQVFSVVGKGLGKIPWGKLGESMDHIPWGRVFNWTKWITDPIGGAVRATGGFASRITTGFTDAFSRQFPRIAQGFSDQLMLLPVRLGDLGRLLKNKAGTLLTDFGEKLTGSIPGWGNKFVRGVLKFFGRYTFWQTGLQLVEGLLSGVGNGMTGIGKWINNHIVQPVVNWTKNLFGIHSPSTVFAEIGGWLISGLKSGVVGGIAGIGKWLYTHAIAPVIGAYAGAGGWLYGRGWAVITGLKSGVLDGVSKIGGWLGHHVISPVKSPFTSAGSWLSGTGSSLISGLKSGVVDSMKDISSWLKSTLVDPIVSAVEHWFGINSPSRVFAGIGGHLVSGLVKGLATSNGLDIAKTVFGDLPSALAAIVGKGLVHVEQLPGKALNALAGVGGAAKDLLDKVFSGGHNDLVGQWATDVRTVLSMLGAPPDALSAVLTRIRIESGGNPNAINLTDSNAKAGHPSQGLMQTIPSTFATYAGPFANRGINDPLASIYAGVNYAMHRYGANWISVMTRPGGYAAGGLAPVGQTAWVGEKGPELMQVTSRGTRIYSHGDSVALAKLGGIQLPGYAAGTVAAGQVAAATRRVQQEQAQVDRYRKLEREARSRAAKRRDQMLAEAAQKRLTAARTELAAAKKLATASGNISNTLANGFLKTLETGTAAGIASAVKSMNTRLQAAGLGSLVPGNLRTSARLQGLANQRASVQSRIAAAQQYATDQSTGLGDFLSLSNTPSASISSLISRMADRQKQASGFASEVAGLSKRGLDKNLLSQLAEAGPGSQLAALLAKASASDIAQLNKLAASQAKLTVSFGRTMADSMFDSGSQAGKGFLSGLQAQEKAIQAEMNRLAAGMVATIKKRLGIRSPSTVMRDQVGRQVALGAALGVRLHAPTATREAQRMADSMAAVRARGGAVPATAGRGGGQVVHYHQHTTYEINARTADYSVAELELLQRKSEARQRVGRAR